MASMVTVSDIGVPHTSTEPCPCCGMTACGCAAGHTPTKASVSIEDVQEISGCNPCGISGDSLSQSGTVNGTYLDLDIIECVIEYVISTVTVTFFLGADCVTPYDTFQPKLILQLVNVAPGQWKWTASLDTGLSFLTGYDFSYFVGESDIVNDCLTPVTISNTNIVSDFCTISGGVIGWLGTITITPAL